MACNCGKSTPRKWGSRPSAAKDGIRVGIKKCPKCHGMLLLRATVWKCSACKSIIPR